MKKFVIGTITIIIIILLLRNVDTFAQIIKTVTEIFNKSFKTTIDVTSNMQ